MRYKSWKEEWYQKLSKYGLSNSALDNEYFFLSTHLYVPYVWNLVQIDFLTVVSLKIFRTAALFLIRSFDQVCVWKFLKKYQFSPESFSRVSLIFHCMFCRTIFHSQVLATVYPLLYIYKGGSANVYVMIASEAEIWDSWYDNENT